MTGIGIDLCEIARMERLLQENDRFLQRYFAPEEQAYIQGRGKTAAQSMAAMFAAKEALLKALGIGIDGSLPLADICVHHAQNGQPCYRLSATAQAMLEAAGASRALLSITHEGGMAAAVAVID